MAILTGKYQITGQDRNGCTLTEDQADTIRAARTTARRISQDPEYVAAGLYKLVITEDCGNGAIIEDHFV